MVEAEAGSNTENIGNATGSIGFYAATPVAKQTVVNNSMHSLQTALIALGLVEL